VENVANDEVVVSYRIEAKGNSAQRLRKQVDEIAAKVSERLKRERVKHKTTNRTLNPVWESGFFSTKSWELVQSGRIETEDVDAVPGWLADIETAGVKLDGLQFQISDKRRRQIEERVRKEAIHNFRAKAGTIAEGVAVRSYRIIDMRTDSRRDVAPMVMRANKLESYASVSEAPSLAGGESKIRITVSGTIETPYKDFSVK